MKRDKISYMKSDPDEDKKQKQTIDPVETHKHVPYSGFKLKKFVGAGGFNCAILIDQNEVYRVRVIRSLHHQKMSQRGYNVLKHFEQNEFHLGPGIIHSIRPGQYTAVLSDDMYRFLNGDPDSKCSELLINTFNPDTDFYFEQILEYIPGGSLDDLISDDTLYFLPDDLEIAFMLIWFMEAAQRLFQFQHRDIKPANILMRKLPIEQVFHFRYEREMFQIKTQYVPYLIDYDQVTFYNSELQFYPQIWTKLYAPPELLAGVDSVALFEYDIYSMGVTILSLWLKMDLVVITYYVLQAMNMYQKEDLYYQVGRYIQNLVEPNIQNVYETIKKDPILFRLRVLIESFPPARLEMLRKMLSKDSTKRRAQYLKEKCFEKLKVTNVINEDYVFPTSFSYQVYKDMEKGIK
jgi:serine/threonine protein kinase